MFVKKILRSVFFPGWNLLKDIFPLVFARHSAHKFKPVAMRRLNIIAQVIPVFVAMTHEPIITSRSNPNPGATSMYRYGFLKESGVTKVKMPKPRYDRMT
jgi:hypothetical protein